VSIEYEYMRTSLVPSLVSAIKINSTSDLKLFEIDKVFLKTGKEPIEKYKVATIATEVDFRSFKRVIELVLSKLHIENYSIEFDVDKPYFHQSKAGTITSEDSIIGEFGEIDPKVVNHMEISEKVYCFEMDIEILNKLSKQKTFVTVPVNPAQIEDITLSFPPKTRVGEVLKLIINNSKLIIHAELQDTYKNAYTFRIWYQDPGKTLTNGEVEKIRLEILSLVKTKFGATVKD
jgi:phenylalanyl-tRNA synthetase beta chain